ncbi:sirohydrochlorin chelatase, partial [Mycobacterium cookii]|nr:sirohydrochlorin chelatase [Mycobacterium cookii]
MCPPATMQSAAMRRSGAVCPPATMQSAAMRR